MYEVSAVDLDTPIRAGEPFFPAATISCEDDDCMDSDVVMAIDGEVIAADAIQLPDGNEFNLRPPGRDVGPRLTSASWVQIGDSGAITVLDPGLHKLTVSVGTEHREIELEVGPPRGRVDPGKGPIS